MRTIVLAAGLTLAGASAAQGQQAQSLASTSDFVPQQVVVATPAPATDLRPVDAPIGMTREKAAVNAAQSNALAAASAADMDPGTRNVLAIIGAVVVVVALVAFLL